MLQKSNLTAILKTSIALPDSFRTVVFFGGFFEFRRSRVMECRFQVPSRLVARSSFNVVDTCNSFLDAVIL